MNNRIEAAYEQRPRRWVFELAVAVVVVALLLWSGSAVETAGTTQNGAVIAWNILAGIFHPDTNLLFNFTTQGVPYLLLETICIAFLGTIVGGHHLCSVGLSFGLQPDSEAGSLCGANHYYGGPHRPRLRLWPHVHSGHRPRCLCRSADHVPVFGRHGEQNVHRSH